VLQPLLLQQLLLRLHSVWASKSQLMHLLLLYMLLVHQLLLRLLLRPVASCSNTPWHQRITQRVQPDATSSSSAS
jgi:hypothetical protein